MSYSVHNNSSTKVGLCPHGLPAGACPICSGGGNNIKKMDRNSRRHAGEMTWNECYAAWQRMKNAKAHKAYLAEEQANIKMQKVADKMAKIFSNIINFPPLKPIKYIAQKALPIVNKFTNFVSNSVLKLANFVKEKFVDISDKIAAMIGEEKLAKMKKAKEFTERALKKIFSVLGFVSESQEEEETSEEVKKEEKKISFLQKIRQKLKFLKDEKE